MNKKPNKNVFAQIGSREMKGGAIFIGKGKEGVNQMMEATLKEGLRLHGIPITKIAKNEIRKHVKKMSAENDKKFEEYGIPNNLQTLFEIRKKSELEKYAKTILVKQIDLVCFIHNRKLLDFNYQFKRKEFVPEFTQLSKDDFKALSKNGLGPLSAEAKKVANKSSTLFEQRRVHHCHLFYKNSEWHCIYFSYEDVDKDNNHWKFGPHLHYTNSFLTNWSRRKIWYTFDERMLKGINELHIKYEDRKDDDN